MSAGRPPKPYDDFLSAAHWLLILARSVGDDTRRPVAWRKARVAQILALQDELLRAPAVKKAG